jgi:phosphate-selective porin OprO/OprP
MRPLALLLLAAAQPPVDPNPEPPKYPTVALGGLLQLDAGLFRQSDLNRRLYGDADDGADFRSARLWARGSLREGTNYMLELDFGSLAALSPGRPNFQNAYIEQESLPVGTVRVGRWKQPFSLETATSIRFLTFIERANLFAFVPFRRTGVGFFDFSEDERTTWAASVFRSSDDGFGGSKADGVSGYATAARLTRLVWAEADDRLLHVGAAHTWNGVDDTARFARFPEFGLGVGPPGGTPSATPAMFDTGRLPARMYQVFGLEAASVYGPLSLQAEGTVAVVDRVAGGDTAVFPGWYVYASYFLTGESRAYIRKAGAFDRVTPRSEFTATKAGVSGTGAWELAVRLSQVDVSDVGGGRLTDLTVGLNWHLNPNAKLQFNYIRAFADAPAGSSTADVFAVRAAYDF